MNIANNLSESFALLDDFRSSRAAKTSRLYTKLKKTIECTDAAELDQILNEMEHETRNGLYAVGCFTYELGAELMGIAHQSGNRPYAEILLFERCEFLTTEEVAAWLEKKCCSIKKEGCGPEYMSAGVMNIKESVTSRTMSRALATIQNLLEAGDTYQVNFTFRLTFNVYGAPCMLYQRLRQRQPVPYGALIVLPDGRAVLSLSPELFLRHESGLLTARPMKGTAQITLDDEQNARSALQLATNPKTVAENVMIVDLLRSDLGRLATSGTVTVPRLFEVERYGNVLQMTSTVTAAIGNNLTLIDVFKAVYPCGSVTGAPKRRTMEIIQDLEDDVRDLYTGAIGWFDPPAPSRGLGDFCMSVPIRTLELQPLNSTGVRQGKMGVGAGIVYDSIAADEIEECRLKGRFLTELPHQFDLIETMYATANDGIRHVKAHIARVRRSAETFGFGLDEVQIIQLLHSTCLRLSAGPHRIKLTLGFDGKSTVQSEPIKAIAEPISVIVAPDSFKNKNILVSHKTSWRRHYDVALNIAQEKGAFDALLYNEKNQLLEGARSNVFLKMNGCWHTPPVTTGILPGIMRAVLLNDPDWRASERFLSIADVYEAEEIMLCNALRGPLKATLIR